MAADKRARRGKEQAAEEPEAEEDVIDEEEPEAEEDVVDEEEPEPEEEPPEAEAGEADAGPPALSAVEAAQRARDQLADLTGRPADTVSGVSVDDGRWRVRVEIVELERVPPSTDVLASYDVLLDRRGELASYERVHRYLRSQAERAP